MAGPFVTHISYDTEGYLTIEKCSVEMNAFLMVVNNRECKSDKVKIK